jgi:hypothetical protein
MVAYTLIELVGSAVGPRSSSSDGFALSALLHVVFYESRGRVIVERDPVLSDGGNVGRVECGTGTFFARKPSFNAGS